MDGYQRTFSSARIADLGDKIILADRGEDRPLPVPGAFLLNGKPTWLPDWPLRIVSSDSGVVPDDKVRGVLRVTVVARGAAHTSGVGR